MLQPKKTKYRKYHRGKIKGKATRGIRLVYGTIGLSAKTPGRISAKHLESGRRSITRKVRRQGKLWIRIFPDTPTTARAAESRMGSGKGVVEDYVAPTQPGKVIYEIGGISKQIARQVLRIAGHKMPCSTKVLVKTHSSHLLK